MNFLIEHTYIGIGWVDLLFVLAFAAVLVYSILSIRRKKNERKELEERLEEYRQPDAPPASHPAE